MPMRSTSTERREPRICSTGAMSRETLVELTRRTVSHARAGTVPQAADIAQVPASNYYDPQRWELEMERVFRRTPLVLGFSAEFREPNSYKAMDVAGMPVLIVRGTDGELRAFVNMCSHRGAVVVEPGSGTSRRFTCPYHAWNYDTSGQPGRHPRSRNLRRHRRRLPRPHAPAVRGARGHRVRHAAAGRHDGHRRTPLRLRRHARSPRHRRCVVRRFADRRRAELEGGLRRLPRLLPSADPAQEHIRARLREHRDLRRLGPPPAGHLAGSSHARDRRTRRSRTGTIAI